MTARRLKYIAAGVIAGGILSFVNFEIRIWVLPDCPFGLLDFGFVLFIMSVCIFGAVLISDLIEKATK